MKIKYNIIFEPESILEIIFARKARLQSSANFTVVGKQCVRGSDTSLRSSETSFGHEAEPSDLVDGFLTLPHLHYDHARFVCARPMTSARVIESCVA